MKWGPDSFSSFAFLDEIINSSSHQIQRIIMVPPLMAHLPIPSAVSVGPCCYWWPSGWYKPNFFVIIDTHASIQQGIPEIV